MSASRSTPRVPAALGTAGKALWKAIIGDLDAGWRLDSRELHLLKRACRVEDELVALEGVIDRDGETSTGSRGQVVVHPALSEARQLRLVQLRLLSALEMENPAERSARATPSSKRAKRAAGARWGEIRRRA